MQTYIVTYTGICVDTYTVEANSPEEALENWDIRGELRISEMQSGEVTGVEEES